MLRIGLAQINPCVGALEDNYRLIASFIEEADKRSVDFLIFPELALTGYPPEDLLLKSHFVDKNIKMVDRLKSKCGKVSLLVGFVNKNNDRIYNSCALIHRKKIKYIYNKVMLPNYGVFDEKRYFSSGQEIPIYDLADKKFTVSICEDIWAPEYISFLKSKKLDFVVNISASPFHLNKIRVRKRVLGEAARRLSAFVFYCNLAGGQDEIVFDGTSSVFSPQGSLIASAARFKEDLLVFNLDKKRKYPQRAVKARPEEEGFLALKMGLHDYVVKNGFEKAVVGVSGGIDSAVVLSIAKLALGSRNVRALIMPSKYTSPGTLRDAKRLCRNLKIDYNIIGIDRILEEYLEHLKQYFPEDATDKTEENLQARIRGNLVMAFSNKFGYIVLNTGNKSELSCGYCTLYGDMVGGFGVLKDVPKTLIYRIARYINRLQKSELIPQSIIRRPPSAELKFDQKDTDTLPSYEILDPILKLYIEEDLPLNSIVNRGFARKIVKKVIRMVDFNEYKRRQAPIGIKITPKAFGKDRRMPITNGFSQK